MQLVFLTLLNICCCTFGLAQTSDDTLMQDPRKAAASFYVYDYKSAPELTPAPAGYEPFYISHFARHGARYCTSEYNRLYDWLTKASQTGHLTDYGKEFFSRYEPFYQKVRYCSGNLTGIGKEQHRTMAERMLQRFPAVFEGPTRVEAVSTESPRVIMSMWSCLSRLVALDGDIDICADASARYASWLQAGLASNPYYVKEYFISSKDVQDAFSDYFDRTVPWREIAGRFFTSADVIGDVLKITPDRFISTLHGVVTGTYCLDEEQGCFDDVFSSEELTQVWKGVSARYFLDVANYEDSGHHIIDYAAFTVEQIIQSADADMASGATQLRLRFGHDAGIGPLITFLDLDGLGRPASTFEEGIEIFPSYNIPMGASVQLVFYRNAAGDILIKALRNEKEASLPFKSAEGPYYRWDDFKKYYHPLISAAKARMEK